ncbi:DegT/DnrJ/EryC1/StrS family aminotransferase [Aquirufa nivalisilvae]|uniref:DegT/DnrJ/EryC1/StrS family aminotransferase n=1 Tax=Aquirufa nivalisilvae TaxID=2516557 RepID=UPI0022A91549|nr:DegT/DnrJ/EryC1/StrS family aminotransferase [Aquirufa nivalisilvae]MCZ2480218.1 DegT/DnrJ/EryC1/StrS family aminotransferase [Aquirufa nivalisilvae]
MLHVTKSFLPDLKEYVSYLERIWESNHLTNDGPLLRELEQKLRNYLQVEHVIFVTNGTIALQLALKALQVKGEVITTPFSYCATSNSILWEGSTPIFADIDANSLTVESAQIKSKITSNTQAILTTHVYGNAGDLEAQEEIAAAYNLPLIYDGAHAFGVNYKGKSIFNYGTVSTCSFHATKVFHSVEGGAVVTNDSKLAAKIIELRSFGHKNDDYFSAGINGKNSEFHAAMGLVNLSHFEQIRNYRKWACELYDSLLQVPGDAIQFNPVMERNYSYYPVMFPTEGSLLKAVSKLNAVQINPRRYFYPSLNTLSFVDKQSCPVSEDIALRVLCLPLSAEIKEDEIRLIADLVNQSFN